MKSLSLTLLLTSLTFLTSFAQNKIKLLKEDNYSIKYPSNWTLDQSGQMGTELFLFSEVTSSKDKFSENINLIIQDVSAHDITLDQFIEISENQIKTLITDANIISSKRVTSGSHDFHKLIYTGKQGEFDIKIEQHCYLANGIVYVLTFTCEIDQFDSYKNIGRKIMGSFRIN